MSRLNRRHFLGATAAGVSAGALEARARAVSPTAFEVAHLRTAQLVAPLGLADAAPSLSWQIAASRRGVRQTAYRIRVASSVRALKAGKADLWDSGRVVSPESTGVAYAGRALKSRERAWWTVTVWDDQGHNAMSKDAAWWEAPLLAESDWTAGWLAVEETGDKADREGGMPAFAASAPPEGQSRLFRLPFSTEMDGEVTLIFLASGLLGRLTVDDISIDLPPHPRTSYGSAPAARFTLKLPAGRHMLAAEILPSRGFQRSEKLFVAAQVHLPQVNGNVVRLNTGWQTALSAGEGWRAPSATGAGWTELTEADPDIRHPAWPAGPAMLLRHGFRQIERFRQARLYVAALGAYEVRLNGRKVSEDRLQSESANYRKSIPYRTYDVSGLLQRGENVLAAMVGDGWYAAYMAPFGRYAFGSAPRRLIAQLEVDGQIVAQTGPGWRMARSPILSSELYNGEIHDARLEQPGWDKAGFDDNHWISCWPADRPEGRLTPQVSPAVRITKTIKPVAKSRLANGDIVVDFGQNFAGLTKLGVKGSVGTVVTARFAEILDASGQVDQSNLRGARATDIYTLCGDRKGETFLPHFTFHGFRYVQLSGLPEEWEIEGQVMSSVLPETGLLRIANPVIQKLWLNTLWSQRSNFLSIPTDCPQRDERLGWTGDAQVFWDAAAFNMDVASFTRRYLSLLRDDQTAKGAFPIFVPTAGGPPGASPGWADAGVMLPWICWRRYGDIAMVVEHWDAMCRYIDGIIADNPDMVWRKVAGPNFADWLALDERFMGDATTPKDLVATAMLKRSLDQIADMGEAIGKSAAASMYRRQSMKAVQAFQAAFVKPDGSIGNDSQAGYILAIRIGLLTLEQKAAAGRRLVADIRRRGTLLSTGFLGTPLSLDALADIGEVGLVYDLLLRTEFPSWGYMVRKGATTIWERWNGDTGDVAMNSFNHYALGAVVGFIYRRIAGIEEIEPGFAALRIAPLIDLRVPSGGADYDSVRGRISTRWVRKSDHMFELDVTIPGNTRGEIHLPLGPSAQAFESGKPLGDRDGVTVLRRDAATVVIEVGSGHYSFSAIT